MLDQTIKNRLAKLEPDYAAFVKSSFAREAAQQLGQAANFNEEKITLLSNGIVLYLLLFLNFEELATFISRECETSNEEASKIVGAVLASLPTEFHAAQEAAYTALNLPNDDNEVATDLASDIAETEAALQQAQTKSIPTIRTMAADMNRAQTAGSTEPTHISSQEDLLRKDPPSS